MNEDVNTIIPTYLNVIEEFAKTKKKSNVHIIINYLFELLR